MSRLNWSGQSIGDSGFAKKLNSLKDGIQYKELDLSHNALTSIPDLRKYRQFANLKVLDLSFNNIKYIDFNLIPSKVAKIDCSYNKLSSLGECIGFSELEYLHAHQNQITQLDWTNLPPALTQLYLYNNHLSSVGDCSQCTQLRELSLSYNQISKVDWGNLPPALTELDLSNNHLSTVGDCSQCTQLRKFSVGCNQITDVDWKNLPLALTELRFYNNQISIIGNCNQCSKLKWFSLRDNPTLQSIQGLPDKEFDFYTDSSVKELGRKCFHQNTYSMLKEMCKTLKWKLEQPPVEVMLQGLEAVLEYYKENSIRTTQTR